MPQDPPAKPPPNQPDSSPPPYLAVDSATPARYLWGRAKRLPSTMNANIPDQTRADVTRLLVLWTGGNQQAMEDLLPLVYDELRKLARRYLQRERPGHTLQSTALVHEAYLRMIDQRDVSWQGRAHFFGIAAQMMRRILVDHARGRDAAKRGAGACKLTLDEELLAPAERDINLVALDQALDTLSKLDSQQGRIVELRFFAGLSIEETAEVLKISPATVKRDWAMAKAFLSRQLKPVPLS